MLTSAQRPMRRLLVSLGLTVVVLLLATAAARAQPTLNPSVSASFSGPVDLVSGDLWVTQMAFGPDGRLYASTFQDGIWRFDYDLHGPLTNRMQVSSINSLAVAFHRADLGNDGMLDTVMYLVEAVPGLDFDPTDNYTQSIVRLTDSNGDGVWGDVGNGEVSQRIVDNLRVTGLHQTNQLQVHGNSLYVGVGSRTRTGGAVMEYPIMTGDDGEFSYTGAINFIEDLNLLSNDVATANTAGFTIVDHSTDTQAFVSTDASKLRVFSTGFRNPYGIAFDRHGQLWVSMNENEPLPPPPPPDVLHRSEFRDDHGFPKRNPNVGDWKDPNASGPSATASQAGYFQSTKLPISELGRAAPGGLDFVTIDGDFLDQVVVSRFLRNDIVAVDPTCADPASCELVPIAFGFFKPLDVLADPAGNLLIADFGQGDLPGTRSIYRIEVERVADLAADWADAATGGTAAGWSYFSFDVAPGGSLSPLQPDQGFGLGSTARGFAGSSEFGTPGVIGDNADGGDYLIFADGELNQAVVGTEVVLHPARHDAAEPFIVLRYTLAASDLVEFDHVTIDGSFRNLVGTAKSGQDSVSVLVFHNSDVLFFADGSSPDGSDLDASTLSEADGSFRIENRRVEVGDTINFLVGPNGNFFGDETAIRARIVPEPGRAPLGCAALAALVLIAQSRGPQLGRRRERTSSQGPLGGGAVRGSARS